MVFFMLILGAFFAGIGFLIHEGNAKYLLAGYNTMGESERKKVDLSRFIPYFRRFHIFLGASFTVLGLLLVQVAGNAAGSVFVSLYPIGAYMYFMWRSGSMLSDQVVPSSNRIGLIVMGLLLTGISVLLYAGMQTPRMELSEQGIRIGGIYGETIAIADIQEISQVSTVPDIAHRKNGMVLGSMKKGYFRTKEGDLLKLLIDTRTPSFLRITKKKATYPVLFSSRKQSVDTLLREMGDLWPEQVRN